MRRMCRTGDLSKDRGNPQAGSRGPGEPEEPELIGFVPSFGYTFNLLSFVANKQLPGAECWERVNYVINYEIIM